MKKYLLFIACIFLLCLPAYASGAAVTGENVTAKAGQEAQAVFTVSADEGFMYLSVSPEFDGNALSARVVNGGFLSELTQGKNLIFTADSDVSGSGTLCVFSIRVSPNAPAGVYEIKLNVRECCNIDEKDVPVTVIPVKVTVPAGAPDWTCEKENGAVTVTQIPSFGSVLAVSYDEKGKMVDFGLMVLGETRRLPENAAKTKLILLNAGFLPQAREKTV